MIGRERESRFQEQFSKHCSPHTVRHGRDHEHGNQGTPNVAQHQEHRRRASPAALRVVASRDDNECGCTCVCHAVDVRELALHQVNALACKGP